MNSSGLGISPKWCQMDCVGPIETLPNLFKAQKGMFSFLGHQGESWEEGAGDVCGERSRRMGRPSPLCSLPPFMCHMPLFKPGFLCLIKAFVSIKLFSLKSGTTPNCCL